MQECGFIEFFFITRLVDSIFYRKYNLQQIGFSFSRKNIIFCKWFILLFFFTALPMDFTSTVETKPKNTNVVLISLLSLFTALILCSHLLNEKHSENLTSVIWFGDLSQYNAFNSCLFMFMCLVDRESIQIAFCLTEWVRAWNKWKNLKKKSINSQASSKHIIRSTNPFLKI